MAISGLQKVVIALGLIVSDPEFLGGHRMWFEIAANGDKTPEQNVSPSEIALAEDVQEVRKAEVLVEVEELKWSYPELRKNISGKRMVTDGPFAETKH